MAVFVVDVFPRPKYMAFGVAGCMISLACEAAIIANFVPSTNFVALRAGVAMLFVFEVFYAIFLDGKSYILEPFLTLLMPFAGTQFAYIGEIFPTHIRAKGICLGVSMISLANIVWLQSAPTAFE